MPRISLASISISTRYLAEIERGDIIPKLGIFILILNTLNASADDVLQDSLVVGYEAKSNDIIKNFETLDADKRKQALNVLECVISALK